MSGQEPRGDATTEAYTVKTFLAAYQIGRTNFYEQVKAKKLRARKLGKRTLILRADAEEWAQSLPDMTSLQ